MVNSDCYCGGKISFIESYKDIAQLFHCDKCTNSHIVYRECDHEFSVFKVLWGGVNVHVISKCKLCGKHGKALKKSDFELDTLPFFDESISSNYHDDYYGASKYLSQFKEKIIIEQKKATNAWNIEVWYRGYLESRMWLKKRAFILNRSEGKCERCGKKAVHVHHKTYERIGYELPEDLMALCKSCHGKEHGENPGLTVVNQFKLNDI